MLLCSLKTGSFKSGVFRGNIPGWEQRKTKRFSDAQKAFISKQGSDGIPVAEICRRAGISQATYFNWKTKYDGLLSVLVPDIGSAAFHGGIAGCDVDERSG